LTNLQLSNLQIEKETAAKWPDLESALNEWQIRMNRKGSTITGYILKQMADKFWDSLPQYSTLPRPSWSEGWLTAFKQRHHISQRMRHGESAGVDRMQLELDLAELRTFLSDYHLDDIYNMDETGLFWKLLPDRTLASEQLPGGKLHKERISVALCCNASGTHKLDPWFIHNRLKPRCFGYHGIKIQTLPLKWRANKKAWMTGKIFRDFLLHFNREIGGRNAVLLVDGFGPHQTGIDLLQDEDITLPNLKIRFLPPNATSLCQPLDQDIIRTWKAYYKKRWLSFAIRHFEKEEDPAKHLGILQALRWGIAAWAEVSPATIGNCWLKSRVLAPKFGPQTRQEAERDDAREALSKEQARYDLTISQINTAIQALAELGRIKEAMPVQSFLDLDGEQVDDPEEDIFEQILDAHADGDCEPEPGDEAPPVPPVSVSEALAGLATLRLYEEQQENGNRDLIRTLNWQERELKGRRANQGTQKQIDSYFRP
jgi:DDE superfamily endonuclease/Tc5 transposase DNA-binding domain